MLPRPPKLEPQYQILFSVIPKTPLLVMGVLYLDWGGDKSIVRLAPLAGWKKNLYKLQRYFEYFLKTTWESFVSTDSSFFYA